MEADAKSLPSIGEDDVAGIAESQPVPASVAEAALGATSHLVL